MDYLPIRGMDNRENGVTKCCEAWAFLCMEEG